MLIIPNKNTPTKITLEKRYFKLRYVSSKVFSKVVPILKLALVILFLNVKVMYITIKSILEQIINFKNSSQMTSESPNQHIFTGK